MTILDATVVNVVIPAFQHQFDASTAQVQWIISCYALALGLTTPLAGALAGYLGNRRVYLLSLGVFTAASLLCGLAPSLPLLIAGRCLQGAAGGLTLPLGMARLFAAFPPGRRGQALGVFGVVLVFAPTIGPLVGGAFADAQLDNWIFFVNVPIGAIGVVLGKRYLARDMVEDRRYGPVPVISLLLTCTGFGGVLTGASLLGIASAPRRIVILAFVVGGISLSGLIIRELRSSNPLLKITLYRVPTYRLGSALNTVGQVIVFGVQFIIPISFQTVGGFSAFEAGLALVPMAITSGLTGLLAGRICDRIGPRLPLVVGFALLTAGVALLTRHITNPSYIGIIGPMILAGAGSGAIPPIVPVAAMHGLERSELADATSLLQAVQRLSQALAVAVLATLLARASPVSGLQQAYLITLMAGTLCVVLACALPGWPGRRS